MEEKIKYEAEYILYNKNKTLEEISDELNISKRTLQNHINTILPEIDKKLYEKVRIKIDETSKLRNIKGGQTSKNILLIPKKKLNIYVMNLLKLLIITIKKK